MVGNKPNYNALDIIRVFLFVEKNTARINIVDRLGLGEGTLRTILDLLKEKRLIYSTQDGHSLTDKGQTLKNSILNKIISRKQIDYDGIYPGQKKYAIQLRGIDLKPDMMQLRDIAVKNNANGALIFQFDKSLYVPGSNASKGFEAIQIEFKFQKGDSLIVSFADNLKEAENGGWAIAATLCSELKTLIGMF